MTPRSTPRRSGTALTLGVCLGGREVGLALVSREHLVRASVLTLAKLPDLPARERRLTQVVARLLDAYGATRLALVDLPRPLESPAHLRCLRRRLEATATERQLPITRYDAARVRAAHTPEEVARPSTRTLAATLCAQFPELAPRNPNHEAVPGACWVPELKQRGRRLRTPKARYWSRMFLALGGALLDLDDALRAQFDHTPPR